MLTGSVTRRASSVPVSLASNCAGPGRDRGGAGTGNAPPTSRGPPSPSSREEPGGGTGAGRKAKVAPAPTTRPATAARPRLTDIGLGRRRERSERAATRIMKRSRKSCKFRSYETDYCEVRSVVLCMQACKIYRRPSPFNPSSFRDSSTALCPSSSSFPPPLHHHCSQQRRQPCQ